MVAFRIISGGFESSMIFKTRHAYERRIKELEEQLTQMTLSAKKVQGRDIDSQIARIIDCIMSTDAENFRTSVVGEVMVLAGMISADTLLLADRTWRSRAFAPVPVEKSDFEEVVDEIAADNDVEADDPDNEAEEAEEAEGRIPDELLK